MTMDCDIVAFTSLRWILKTTTAVYLEQLLQEITWASE